MSPPPPLPPAPPDAHRPDLALRTLVVAATLAMLAVLLPFYGAVLWAVILALVFRPLQRRLVRRLQRPGWAAAITLLVVILVVVLPLLGLSAALAREGARFAQAVQTGAIDLPGMLQGVFNALPGPVSDLLGQAGISNVDALRQRIEQSAGRVAQFLAGHVLDMGQVTVAFVVQLFVALYTGFFMLRDGDALSAQVWAALPLGEHHKRALRERITTVLRATVKGNLVVAVLQGGIGGVVLAVLGVPGALLAGALIALFSLLPAVGSALVWGPIALYLLATGDIWRGVALTVIGVGVISMVDNLLRPILVGRDTRLPDWLVLVTTVGGIALIGLNGFVVGPLVASVFVAAWGIYARKN
ncbi:AI-2E family transporter [Ideonella sp.]|uniref:AI-2E family transporter n=1 Tax=Ideonella sp. TaxID=1929293 RepID=UPI0035B1061E